MNRNGFLSHGAQAFGAALVLGLTGPLDSSSSFHFSPAAAQATAGVSERDVSASNEKVRMAHRALAEMWDGFFRENGVRFAVPGLVRYRGGAPSACGIMRRNNAGYCPTDNSIYFDEVFVAAQARAAARQLGTDGDMAAVGIIAHEMGHAVALQLGYRARTPYANEAAADCLAGAFAQQSARDGSLEKGDVEEALFGMAAAGDPEPQLTGDERMDRRILRLSSMMGHGTDEQRTANFRRGLDGGARACFGQGRS